MKTRSILYGLLFSLVVFLFFLPIGQMTFTDSRVLPFVFAILFALPTLVATVAFMFGYAVKMPTGIMAITTFYSPSNLVTGQAKLDDMFSEGALKEIDPVTFKAFRKNTEIMIPSHKLLRTREDRPLAAYYKLRTLRNLANGRSYNATGNTGTSAALVPSFTIWSDTMSTSIKLMDDNVFSWEEMYANEMRNIVLNFSAGNEKTATQFAFNNRSSVNIAVAEGAWNATNNVFEIQESVVGNRQMMITNSMMAENKWTGWPLTVFCDTISFNKFAFAAQQGASNFENTSFQYMGKTYIMSLELTAMAQGLGYNKGFWLAIPDGLFAVLDWIPRQNREGVNMPPYKYYTLNNPIDGLDYAAYEWYIGTDSFTNSVSNDIQLNYQVSVDLAFEFAPLTNPAESPCQAVALV